MSELLEVRHLKKYFKTPRGMLHAVDDVSFTVGEGTTLGIVGESGCGKSTLGRTIMRLHELTDGELYFDGRDITDLKGAQLKALRQEIQMIFQDPFSSLDPRMAVSELIAEPLVIYKKHKNKADLAAEVAQLMDTVGLARRLANAYPHELDGGRRQRIGVARALSLNPRLLVCDEPVSALDVSIQAQILNLMQDLQQQRKLTYLFITHNISVVKHVSDEIIVMYLGMVVEHAKTKDLFAHPLHPYTKALLDAVPIPMVGENGKSTAKRTLLKGEISSPIEPKPGCRFAPRCPYADALCFTKTPLPRQAHPGHTVVCHYPLEAMAKKGGSV